MGDNTRIKITLKLREPTEKEIPLFNSLIKILNNWNTNTHSPDIINSNFNFSHPYWEDERSGFINLDFQEPNIIFVNANFKNYDKTIQKFLHWLYPYLDNKADDVVGKWESDTHDKIEKFKIKDWLDYKERFKDG